MGSATKVDKDNIIEATADYLPKDIRQMLEERKKCDKEELKAALASIKIDRRDKVTKNKEVDFASTCTDASTEVTPNVSGSSFGVTLDHVKKLQSERDVR